MAKKNTKDGVECEFKSSICATFCSGCHARLTETDGSANSRSKAPVAPYQAEAEGSRTKIAAEKYKEKTLRAKEKVHDLEVRYPRNHQRASRLSGGDAESLRSGRTYTIFKDSSCCSRKASNPSPKRLGQNKKGDITAKLSPPEEQENGSVYSGHFTDSDTELHLDLGDDLSSTTSLKTMGSDDDEASLKTHHKVQSPVQHCRNIPSLPTKPSPRRETLPRRGPQRCRHMQVVSKIEDAVEVKIEVKPLKLYGKSKSPSSQRDSPTERYEKPNQRKTMRDYEEEHQRLSRRPIGDSDRPLNVQAYNPCSDNVCVSRRTCQQFGQIKNGNTPVELSPPGQQENRSFYSERITDADLALQLSSGDDKGTSSSTTSTKLSVREIRRVMTSRCRVHDILTASLKAMGCEEDETTPETQGSTVQHCRDTPPRLTKPSPGLDGPPGPTPPVTKVLWNSEVSSRKLTLTKDVIHTEETGEATIEWDVKKLSANLKPPETSVRATAFQREDKPMQRRNTPIYACDTPNHLWDTQIHPCDTPTVSKAPPKEHFNTPAHELNDRVSSGVDFENSLLKALKAEVMSPIIQKVEKMHYHVLRSQVELLDELSTLPNKMSQVYNEHLQSLQKPKDSGQ